MADQTSPDPALEEGVPTTGHEWDGIREYDKPLPRWWKWTFYACIIWSIGYWIAMPAWPTVSGYTEGMLGYSQRAKVASQLEARREAQSVYVDRIGKATLEEITKDQELLEFSLAGGRSAFAVNCSQCHGTGAQGSVGYPNLNDDDWLWGGTLAQIEQTILYGIRSEHEDARVGDMPAFGRDEVLEPQQITQVTDYVMSLSGRPHNAASAAEGKTLFADNCASCHGENGKGNAEFGSPNLTDAIWLWGSDRATIRDVIYNARKGVMPPWHDKLSPETIKQLTVYVHSLGGGR